MKYKVVYDVTARLEFDVEANSLDEAISVSDSRLDEQDIDNIDVRGFGPISVFDGEGNVLREF